MKKNVNDAGAQLKGCVADIIVVRHDKISATSSRGNKHSSNKNVLKFEFL